MLPVDPSPVSEIQKASLRNMFPRRNIFSLNFNDRIYVPNKIKKKKKTNESLAKTRAQIKTEHA